MREDDYYLIYIKSEDAFFIGVGRSRREEQKEVLSQTQLCCNIMSVGMAKGILPRDIYSVL